MAKINLRAYTHEIETLVDQNQFDQAVSHARHILKIYPKNIQAYRLLGKAYLESQRYGDAADIFQRVLSAIPDDFVSHVGMSIIREDESNLDEAIWHMERAFEVQPANNAIQGELRRLYGRRDGLEPPKVRLTRGALARMYLKGELYPQAIGELRAALAEDPERQDLQTLLAQAYFQSNQRVESANVCNTILKKMPYCLDANRILANILAGTERAQEANTYRQRMIALDPYYGQLSPGAPTVEKVPDAAVLIEKYVYVPGQTQDRPGSQPDWAASLGVKIQQVEGNKEALPDWLMDRAEQDAGPSKQDDQQPVVDFDEISPTPEQAEINPEAAIPDWMKAAGWQPANDNPEETISDFSLEDLAAPPDEAAPGDIPDWLKEIAPPDTSMTGELKVETPEQQPPLAWTEKSDEAVVADLPDWLSAPEDDSSTGSTDFPPAQTENIEPAVYAETSFTAETPNTLSPSDEDAAFAWLESLAAKQGASEALFTNPQERDDTPPDWVRAAAQEGQQDLPESFDQNQFSETTGAFEPAIEPSTGIPDWLKSAASDDWLADLPSDEKSSLEAPAQEEFQTNDLDAWMPEPARLENTPEPGLELPGSSEIPDWLKDLEPAEEPAGIQLQQESYLPPVVEEKAQSTELPDWLQDLGTGAAATAALSASMSSEDEFQAEPASELPDWLSGIAEEQPEARATAIPSQAAPSEPPGVMPSWLEETDTKAAEPAEFSMLFGPKVLAAASKQPEAEPEVVESDTKPTRVRGESTPEIAPDVIVPPIQPEAEPTTVEPAAEIPDWLRGISDESAATAAAVTGLGAAAAFQDEAGELPAAEPQELPDWLKDIPGINEKPVAALDEPEPEEPAWIEPAEISAVPTEELPDWLKDLSEPAQPPEPIETVAYESETITEPIAGLPGPETEPVVEIPDWLKGLGDIDEPLEQDTPLDVQPVVDAEVETISTDEDAEPAQELPEWLRAISEEPPVSDAGIQESLPSEVETPAVSQVETDDAFAWLEMLAARQGATEALQTTPESRPEAPPEWVTKAAEESASEPFLPEQPPVEESFAIETPFVEEIPTVDSNVQVDEETSPLVSPAEVDAVEFAAEVDETTPTETTGQAEPAWLFDQAEPESLEETTSALDDQEPGEEQGESAQIPELPTWLLNVDEGTTEEPSQWVPPVAAPEPAIQEVQAFEPAFAPLDLNQAGLVEIERLPGMGYIRAQAILEYRKEHGAFASVRDLLQVTGIDEPLLEQIEDRLFVARLVQEPAEETALPASDNDHMRIIQARNALIQGDSQRAIEQYNQIIRSNQFLPDVVRDLTEALYRYPMDILIWQTLGDAYVRSGNLQEALDAYTKAEELLR